MLKREHSLKTIAFLMFIIATAFVGATAHAAWQPPIGIPTPPFGINEIAPSPPSPWTAPVPGFYYIDQGVATATDTNNPYGYPGKPRRSIPNPFAPSNGSFVIPAGSLVIVNGTYNSGHSATGSIQFGGTAEHPVFLRGLSDDNPPVFTAGLSFYGTYGIVEHVKTIVPAGKTSGGIFVGPWYKTDADHIVIRHSEIVGGPAAKAGLFVASPSNQGTHGAKYTVLYHNHVHHQGDVNIGFDQDSHCVSVGPWSDHLWILDNEFDHCSGDGIQFNGWSAGTIKYSFVGRNVSHDNKQYGMGTKYSEDTIFSQNRIYHHRVSNSSTGGCMYLMYSPLRVWFLYNDISDCETGFRNSEDGKNKVPTDYYWIGNVIHNIHVSSYPNPNKASPWEHGLWSVAGNGPITRHLLNNTAYDFEGGIYTSAFYGVWIIKNNVFWNGPQNGWRLMNMATHEPDLSAKVWDYNLAQDGPVSWGVGAVYPSLAAFHAAQPTQGKHDILTDPLFVDAGNGNFALQATSPAVDAGALDAAYATFFNLYGVNIAKDIAGNPRPQGATYDLGAYELNTNVSAVPPPPADVTVR